MAPAVVVAFPGALAHPLAGPREAYLARELGRVYPLGELVERLTWGRSDDEAAAEAARVWYAADVRTGLSVSERWRSMPWSGYGSSKADGTLVYGARSTVVRKVREAFPGAARAPREGLGPAAFVVADHAKGWVSAWLVRANS